MAFSSTIYTGKGEIIIDDTNAHLHYPQRDRSKIVMPDGTEVSKGYESRPYDKVPVGSVAAAPKYDKRIPRSEWPARIEEREKRDGGKHLLSNVLKRAGIPSKNQNGTNYCWYNGPVGAFECIRQSQGQKYLDMSPASGAAVIKRGANEGGWGLQAVEHMAESGICTSKLWEPNARNYRELETELVKLERAFFRVTAWWDLPEYDFDMLMTCLLLGFPVCMGLNWWGHEVYACDPLMFGGNDFGVRFRNSWGDSYGDGGFNTLRENKSKGDCQCLRDALPAGPVPQHLATAL